MKIINQSIIIISCIVATLLLFSCGHDHDDHDDHDHGTEQHSDDDGHNHGEAEHEEGEIHLTKAQIKTMNIQFGDFSSAKIDDFVSATGNGL